MRTLAFEHDGAPVEHIQLKGGGLTADFLTFGAVLQNLQIDGWEHPLVLGFEDPIQYVQNPMYFGATVGRFANRIAQGQFSIGQRNYQLEQNEASGHHLHGGQGISHRNWSIVDLGENYVKMQICDPDGQSGYPGNCDIIATFQLLDDGCLDIEYACQSDQATIANIAHHSYFNLDGSRSISDHHISMDADCFLPVDQDNIPYGQAKPVQGTEFDFLKSRPIKDATGFVDYDHNFCVSSEQTDMRKVAEVASLKSGVMMQVLTTEPGVQFFTSSGMAEFDGGLGGQYIGANAGFCLETQIWPDAPNHPNYPTALLKPGELRVQKTQYRFYKNNAV